MFLRVLLISFVAQICWSQQGGIMTLEEGTCWAQNTSNSIKLSSFIEGVATEINRYSFSQSILDKFSLEDSSLIDISYHCTSSKSWLLVNLQSDNFKACLHFGLDKQGVVLEAVYSNPRQTTGSCQGVETGKLLVFSELSQKQKDYLVAEYPVDQIQTRGRYSKISLSEDVYYAEGSLKEKLDLDPNLKNIRFEFNSIVLPVGTRVPMN